MARLGISIDTMHARVSREQIDAWKNLGARHGLSQEDATMIAEIKASARARNVQNPVLLRRDAGGTLLRMRARGRAAMAFFIAGVHT